MILHQLNLHHLCKLKKSGTFFLEVGRGHYDKINELYSENKALVESGNELYKQFAIASICLVESDIDVFTDGNVLYEAIKDFDVSGSEDARTELHKKIRNIVIEMKNKMKKEEEEEDNDTDDTKTKLNESKKSAITIKDSIKGNDIFTESKKRKGFKLITE